MSTPSRHVLRLSVLSIVPAVAAGCANETAFEPGPVGALDRDGNEITDVVLFDGDDRVALPALEPPAPEPPTVAAAAADPEIHYVNFSDGTTTLIKGPDDATKNQTIICGTAPKAWPKFPISDAEKKTFVMGLAKIVAAYNVVVVANRPATGEYSMEMVGKGDGNGCTAEANVAGISPVDCGNRSRKNVSFTFIKDYRMAGQESGHGWGLDHTDVACDVMGLGYSGKGCSGGTWGFPDVDGKFIGGSSCGLASQNSHKTLLKNLGAWGGGTKPDPWAGGCEDAAAPELKIDEPADGATVGSNFQVKASAHDDCAGVRDARIEVPIQSLTAKTDGGGPFDWKLTDIRPGSAVEIRVIATDRGGKETVRSIKVNVMAGGGGGAGGGAGGAGGSGQDPTDPPAPDDKVASGCTVGSGRPDGIAWLAAVLVTALIGRGRRSGNSRR